MTVAEALAWMRGGWKSSPYAKTIPNVGMGIDVDGLYGFQCKDWANGYAAFIGDPFTSGNAIALWQRNQPGWTKSAVPKLGSVFVKNYVASDGVNYGHTGTVDEITGDGFWSYDQNVGPKSNLTIGVPPQRVFHKNSEVLGFLVNNKLGVRMNREQATYLAQRIGLLAGMSEAEITASWLEYHANNIMGDLNYPAALCKQLYEGDQWQKMAWKSVNFQKAVDESYEKGKAEGSDGDSFIPVAEVGGKPTLFAKVDKGGK